VDDSTRLVQRHYQGKSGKVTVVVASSNRAAYSKCLREFAALYPDIVVDTSILLGYEQPNVISKGDFDVCFVAEYLLENNANFEYAVTFPDRLCLAVPESFDIADASDFSGISKYPFISISLESAAALHEDIQRVCLLRNYSPRVIHQYNRIEAVLLSVEAGAGVSIVPFSTATAYQTENVRFLPISGDDCAVNCVAGWSAHVTNSAAVKFRDVILSLYPKNQNLPESSAAK
jgi:DNA-binding transcriptional LysR family regulator